MRCAEELKAFLAQDAPIRSALEQIARLDLPDCWIGAGFIRNSVWDFLHGFTSPDRGTDVDVVYFQSSETGGAQDREIASRLQRRRPDLPWSVKNQARMHRRNGDAPYADTLDAIRHWPDTATSIAARLRQGQIDILAPHGIDDLLALIVRPTPAFIGKMDVYRERVQRKNWQSKWPNLRICGLAD